MIRTRPSFRARLGDAASDNIGTALFGNTSYAAQTGQTALVSQIAANLAAGGIDPTTASQAQIMAAYQPINTAAYNAAAAALATTAVATTPTAPVPATTPAPGILSTITGTLSSIPTWGYWAAGAAALFLVFSGGSERRR